MSQVTSQKENKAGQSAIAGAGPARVLGTNKGPNNIIGLVSGPHAVSVELAVAIELKSLREALEISRARTHDAEFKQIAAEAKCQKLQDENAVLQRKFDEECREHQAILAAINALLVSDGR